MTAQSPGAYFLSALLHGAIAGLILFFAYTAEHLPEPPPKIMELVAGAGSNYGATAAPALGVPGAIKVRIPTPLPPLPAPAPPEPAPSEPAPPESPAQVQPAPEEKSPVERAHVTKNEAKQQLAKKPAKSAVKSTAKPALRPPNFLADLKRLERKREARLEKKYQEELSRERAHEAAAEARVKHIDAEGIREGVIGGSKENTQGGAEGKALTREEGNLMESYFAFVLQHLKVTFEELKPQDVSDSLSATAEFMLAADGSISGGRVVRSSGNAAFDRAVLECLAHAKSVGPRPDHKSELSSATFNMKDEPGT